MKKFLSILSWFTLLPALVLGQGKVYLRASEGTKPFTFQLYNASGTLVETRQSSKSEEQFTAPGWGYQWRITDATNAFKTGSVDAVTHELMNKQMVMKAIYFYTGSVEASGVISDVQQIPGFNTASIQVHSYQIFGNAEKYNHARWSQAYDHTVPNQSFTAEQDLNSLDRVIYNAYNTGTNIQNRVQLRLVFSGSMRIDEISQKWGYGIEDLPRQPSGELADSRPSLTYQVRFPSYASDRALNFFKECFKKLCFRYQKAINDGTIREISFQLNESGESNISGGYYDSEGKWSLSMGDYSTLMKQRFSDFCKARFGTIQQMNAKLGTSIKSFTLDDQGSFGNNMLLNGADGGNDKDNQRLLQKLWQWYLAEAHDLFEYEIQKYAYEQVPITRSRLYCFDVGSIMNGDFFRMKSFNFRQRLLKYDRWMTVKTNNSNEGELTPEFVVDQVTSGARLVGAVPCWEPSPQWYAVYPNILAQAAAICMQYSIGLSAYSAPAAPELNPPRPDAMTFWKDVSSRVNLPSFTTTFKPNDLDASGNIVTLRIPFLLVALDGFTDHNGDYRVNQLWREARAANPGKLINIIVDDADVRALFTSPYPIVPGDTSTPPGGGGGEEESDVQEVNPLSDVSLSAVPTYSLPAGAINMTADAVPWVTQVDYAKRGMVNYVNPGRLADERGGIYHPDWNPNGITEAALQQELASYNLPASVSLYRMMYSNAVDDIWPAHQPAPYNQQALNERIEGFAIGYRNSLGWTNHPIVLDVDFEDGRFFTYAGVKAQADAIKYLLSRNANVRVQVYASAHNNLSVDGGGSPSNPNAQLGPAERFRLFKEAGVSLFQGTIPYFHVPSFFWTDPSHEPSVIGSGKLYSSHADYAKKSLHPIVAKLGWTDNYFGSIPAGHTPANIEWIMAVYEGGDDGLERQYDQQGNWISGLNWPEVGGWILESLPVWGVVTGSYRYGGGVYNWSDNRPRKVGQDYLEAGKWRAYQFNRFSNNPATQYNIKLEYSLDGGQTWQTDARSGENLLAEHSNPKPYVRGAYVNGELLIVAVAGQPFHLNYQSQPVKIRYQGKQVSVTLQPQKVHSFAVSI